MKNGPAYVDRHGTKRWYLNGELHREDGPAYVDRHGTKRWYLNGELHREDGPARELANGGKQWYRNDKLHREDGPAIEEPDGSKEYWINGKGLSKGEIDRIKIKNDGMSDEDLDIMDQLGLFEGKILDYMSFKNANRS